MSASALTISLRQVAHVTVAQHPGQRQTAADELLRNIVRGAQHELAFGDILKKAAEFYGLTYRRASTAEDLKGADYIVIPYANGPDIKVDVKASMSTIENKNKDENEDNKPFSVNNKGDITMFSLVNPGDKFTSDHPETDPLRVTYIGLALTQALEIIAA